MSVKRSELAAAAIVVIILGAAYFFLSAPPAPPPAGETGYPAPFSGLVNTSLEEFAQSLLVSQKVLIVEDLRGLEAYPISRNNIMQCGVDFSGSEGLTGKELMLYALEGEACTTISGVESIADCHSEISSFLDDPSATIIWIEKGSGSIPYGNHILVGVNETYSQGGCHARFESSAPPAQEELPMNGTSGGEVEIPQDGGEALPPANDGSGETPPNDTGELPQNETGEEELPQDGEGDSVTFP
jgi:hypothetical protein